MCGFLGDGAAMFEIRDVAGDTDMLVSNGPLGAALAAALGARSAVLMRGHGSTVVGSSLEQAVYRAIYTEVNARLQAQAIQLGEVRYLSAGEAAKAAVMNDSQLPRAWELWTREVGADRLATTPTVALAPTRQVARPSHGLGGACRGAPIGIGPDAAGGRSAAGIDVKYAIPMSRLPRTSGRRVRQHNRSRNDCMRVFNFSAGPAVLPEPVLQKAAAEMLDWHGCGMSVMEMSHRGKEFIAIAAKAEADLRALLAIPANYKVLFLQGGAIAENAVVPLNLLRRPIGQPTMSTPANGRRSRSRRRRSIAR